MADREATAEVEEVRKMLIMDFAGFPGQHYIGSAERIVEFLRASRQERSHVEGTVSPVKGWLPRSAHPDEQPGLGDLQLTPEEAKLALRFFETAPREAEDGFAESPMQILEDKLRRLASRETDG